MRRKGFTRIGAAFAVGLTLTLLSGSTVTAHPDMQHGENTGHLPPVQRNVDLIGKLDLFGNDEQPGRVSDVAAFGNYAYLGAFAQPNCQNTGVYVIDIANPADPTEVGFIPTSPATHVGEGVQVLDMKTAAFEGQVLLHNNETCIPGGGAVLDDPRFLGGPGGASLWNVSDPLNPQPLAVHVGDTDPPTVTVPPGIPSGVPHQTHSVFGWQQGEKAYMVVMDNGESASTDIDIFDITNPSSPQFVLETGLDDFPQIVEDPMPHGSDPGIHDFMVNKFGDKYLFLGSYWDGGYIILDFTDLPEKVTFLRDTDFGFEPFAAEMGLPANWTAEGNAHQAEFNRDGTVFLAADEDFNPFRLVGKIGSGPYAGEEFTATGGSNTPAIPESGLTGPTDFLGSGCNPVLPVGEGKIALMERGTCTFTIKVQVAQAAGYEAAVIFNDKTDQLTTNNCDGQVFMLAVGDIPSMFVSRSTGLKFLQTDPGANSCDTATPLPGSPSADFAMVPIFDGWGYLHLYDAKTMEPLDHWALPESLNPAKAEGFGDLSIHEVAIDPDYNIAYSSHYAGGFRIFQFDRTNGIREVGAFIDEGGNNFWGVEVLQHPTAGKIVLASDRDAGLYIFKHPLPDLTVTNIASSKKTIRGGDQVTLTATVTNIGAAAAEGVTVQFKDGGAQIGTVQTIASIPVDGTGTASVVWNTKHLKGQRTITATADHANAIVESDESNNTASRVFTVRGNKIR